MQEIHVRLADHARRRGRINALRIAPGSEDDVELSVEYIGFAKE